jgi:hypothetical protein
MNKKNGAASQLSHASSARRDETSTESKSAGRANSQLSNKNHIKDNIEKIKIYAQTRKE